MFGDRQKSTKFVPGDTVRIAKQKKHFEKSYLPNYTNDMFIIKQAKPGQPNTYEIQDMEGDEITGKFYGPEFSKAAFVPDQKFVIEKVLDKRHTDGLTEYKVKLKNSNLEVWISEQDLL